MDRFEFAILGPLVVRRGGQQLALGGSRERALVGKLLLEADGVVPMARLVGAIWDDNPPDGAEKAVRNCVSSLRRRFADARAPEGLIETDSVGYRLRLAGCGLDLREFTRLVAGARQLAAVGEAGQAVTELRAALGLWRGPALAGVGGTLIGAAAARLDEQRLTALEECLDLELTLGRHRQVTPELRGHAAEWPLRERLARQLMLALYRSGRQAEALETFHRLAKRLADDLGLDPSSEITQLHEAILRQDPALDLPRSSERGERCIDVAAQMARHDGSGPRQGSEAAHACDSQREHPVPAQLPLDVPSFTGRIAELARLRGMLPEPGRPDRETVVISAIGGTAGMGKTALAVHFAHQVADRFPDGQLYVNLRGFDPSGSPTPSAAALRGFLGALGVAGEAIPPEIEQQSALFRTLLTGKRILILLDNAHDAEQVRPLLPGGPGCLVIITSRRQLTGLAAAEGVHLLSLDVLTDDEAAELLAGRLGEERLNAEPEAVGELAALCAGLPLALAIVSARAAARPGLGLAEHVAELRDACRLDALDTGDPTTDLRAVFSWSYRQLSEPAARMFRLLGLHPGADITAPAAASLADAPPPQARATLRELTGMHLLTEHEPARYTFHDLLRSYAAELASEPDAADDPQAALTRLCDYYLATAAAAMELLYPAETHRRPRIRLATLTPGLVGPQAALAWLDAERPNLVELSAYAAAHGFPLHAIRLSATVFGYLRGGHSVDGLAIHGHARDAARQLGDRTAEAEALRLLGSSHWRLGRYAQSVGYLDQALALYQHAGDQVGQARTLNSLGAACWYLGDHRAAIRHQEQALALFGRVGDRLGKGIVLNNLGDGLARLGRYHESTAYLRETLALARQDGDRDSEAGRLHSLGEAEQGFGRPKQAAKHFRQALALYVGLGNRTGEAVALTSLGNALTSLGQPEQAADRHRHALALFRLSGERGEEPRALNGLGEAARAAGDAAEAVTHHASALKPALDTGNREQQARAHAGLGRAHEALGQLGCARKHYQQALDLYTALGYPEAGRIQDHLAAGSAH